MGGGACVVIIEGNGVQGNAALLTSTASASCQLVEYLRTEENWNEADTQPIVDFHLKANERLAKLNSELNGINRALAAKYNRTVG